MRFIKMFKIDLARGQFLMRVIKLQFHKKIYSINIKKLNSVLEKIGAHKFFDEKSQDIKDFLFGQKLLYTEFLEFISDEVTSS